jgi:hypothetical protein
MFGRSPAHLTWSIVKHVHFSGRKTYRRGLLAFFTVPKVGHSPQSGEVTNVIDYFFHLKLSEVSGGTAPRRPIREVPMWCKSRFARRLGAIGATAALAAVLVPGGSASAGVNVWRDTNFSGPGIGWDGLSIRNYYWYRYYGTVINVNDSASSYYNDTDFKEWFYVDSSWRGSSGWSNPHGSGNFGSVLNNKVSSHRNG